jgi:DNA-binding winged helix-turn-helix (wHTH) protein
LNAAQPEATGTNPPGAPPSRTRLRFANAEYDPAAGTLRVDGLPVVVEPRPLRLLAALLQRPGQVLSKDELFRSVWQGRATVDHVLASAVSKLRAALGPEAGARIVTVPRLGYRLEGPVQSADVPVHHGTYTAGQCVPGREAYVLESRLGSAPSSEVWLARHAHLGQARVFKLANDVRQLALLRRELAIHEQLRQALGAREDLVPVLDTQFRAAPFFLECEYGGSSLERWAAADGAWARMPRAERLDLFLQVAGTVADAHAAGVVHGDIRPAHVLLQQLPGRCQARLVGFGGTPAREYLPPERLSEQPATAQGDVYALGLLLWQLMCGDLKRPLVTGWRRELDDTLLCEDIEAATEGQVERRLSGAVELVARVSGLEQRRLAQQRAHARVQEEQRRAAELQRLRQRRPWLLAAVGSLATGAVASVLFGMRGRAALQQAQDERQRAEAMSEYLQQDVLAGLGEQAVGPDATVSMRAVLEQASARAERRFRDHPEQESLVRGQLAGVFQVLSMFDRAEVEFRKALALAARPGAVVDTRVLTLRFDLARHLSVHNKLPEARDLLAQTQREAALLLHEHAALALAAIAAEMSVLISNEQFEAAVALGAKLVTLADQHVRAERPHEWFVARIMWADAHFRLGRLAAAERLLSELLGSPAPGVGDVTRSRARICLARVRHALGQPDAAESELQAARAVLLQRIGPDEHYVQIATAELASIFDSRGDFVKSRALFREARDSFARAVGAEHPSTLVMELNLAISDLNLGQPARGLQQLDSVRAWFVRYMGGERGAVVQAIDFERARALTGLDRPGRALELLGQLDAKVIASAAPARDWPFRLRAETARAVLRQGHRAQGLALLEAALPGLQQHGTPAWLLARYQSIRDQALLERPGAMS